MAQKRLPYKESSVFLVPLERGGHARGVVARAGKRGKILLGYFFAPSAEDNAESLDGLLPHLALLRIRFGDLGLIRGDWKVVGAIEPWDRAVWPIPEFLWSDPLHRIPDQVVVYSDENFETLALGRQERRAIIPQGLTRDGLSGSRSVEIQLSRLLAGLPTA